jgi:acyl-CoA reductase-like NAD-dependent aldehyde dehydrogenase
LVIVLLASNLPGLAVQSLLPAVALGCRVLVKSASAEPLFAPAFLAELCRREPGLEGSLAAVTWPGGDRALEDELFAHPSRIIAYGGGAAMASLGSRVDTRLIAYGPKLSLALVDADVDPSGIAGGLARDIALFDQRGCLSVQAIYTAGDSERLAKALARALVDRARVWPPGEVDVRAAVAVRQLRDEATMQGLLVADSELHQGTVVVESHSRLKASPGLRTVRIYPVPNLCEVPPLLAGWKGRLQGAALAGAGAWQEVSALQALGFSHLASPGELQTPTASWHNGGISPLSALGESL